MTSFLDAPFDEPLEATASRSAVAPIAPTDGERLMRFRRRREEAALAEVVEAHAAMVWGVCSQVLRHRQDIEDAFQATFLILARKAKAIRAADSAAGWLYRVAFRTALLVRSQRRQRSEQPLTEDPMTAEHQLADLERSEQCLTLLEELHALPHRYRQALVLCYFEGRSRRQAADELGITAATVKGRLARGTRMLRTRLVRRGAALSSAMAVATTAMSAAHAAATPALVTGTATLGMSFALKSALNATGGALKKSAAFTLAQKGLFAMTIAAAAKPAAGILAVGLMTGLLTMAVAESPEHPESPVLMAAAELGDGADVGTDTVIDAQILPSEPVATFDPVEAIRSGLKWLADNRSTAENKSYQRQVVAGVVLPISGEEPTVRPAPLPTFQLQPATPIADAAPAVTTRVEIPAGGTLVPAAAPSANFGWAPQGLPVAPQPVPMAP